MHANMHPCTAGFPEEMVVTHVQTLQDKNFFCAEFAIRYILIACRSCTVNKETCNILHSPSDAEAAELSSLEFSSSGGNQCQKFQGSPCKLAVSLWLSSSGGF